MRLWVSERESNDASIPHAEWILWLVGRVAGLSKAIAEHLNALRGDRSYQEFADELGIGAATLHRLISGDQSLTVDKLDSILEKLNLSVIDVLGSEASRKRGRRG